MQAQHSIQPQPSHALIKRLAQILGYLALTMSLFFLGAGRLDILMAWVYVAVYLIYLAVMGLVMHDQELIKERSHTPADAKSLGSQTDEGLWPVCPDDVLCRRAGRGTLHAIAAGSTAGADRGAEYRNPVAGVGRLGDAHQYVFLHRRAHPSGTRASRDRHRALSLRAASRLRGDDWIDPRDTAGLRFTLGLDPRSAGSGIIVARTAAEDRTLQAELPGYAAYARRVRYRLLPGIW